MDITKYLFSTENETAGENSKTRKNKQIKRKREKKWEEVKRLYFEKEGRFGKEEVVGLGRGNFKGLMCDYCLKTGKKCVFILCHRCVIIYRQQEDGEGETRVCANDGYGGCPEENHKTKNLVPLEAGAHKSYFNHGYRVNLYNTSKDFCMPLVCSGYCNKTWIVENAMIDDSC